MSIALDSPPRTGAATGRQLGALFGALADPTRLELLRRLRSEGPRRVSELVGTEGARQPAVSKHLACLHGCGLISRERRGRTVVYALVRPEVAELIAGADRVWEIARCGESCTCDCCAEGGEP